jgi:tetratricopeptide (TPR) repeat protein
LFLSQTVFNQFSYLVTAYSETIKRNSSNLDAYWLRGVAYYQLKNYDAAIADCDTVIKGAPDFSTVYVVRGDAYGAKGVYRTAIADYKTGLEKGFDPNGYDVDKSSKVSMWFCGAMYMEIVVNRFLGNSAAVTKNEAWLKTVCDKNSVTRAEVEAFYRQNIDALIAEVVTEKLNEKRNGYVPAEVYAQWKRLGAGDAQALMTDAITRFYLEPSQTTFRKLVEIYARQYELTLNGDLFAKTGEDTFMSILNTLNPSLRDKVGLTGLGLNVKVADLDPRYKVFSTPYR